MKRIREFKLVVASSADAVEHRVTGWHKAWDLAVASIENPGNDCRIYDGHIKHSPVITFFTEHEIEQDESSPEVIVGSRTRWRSEPFHTGHGQIRYAQANMTDFGWKWVEGAERELPFRLNYFEHKAERHPEGWTARIMELWAEVCDLFRPVGS